MFYNKVFCVIYFEGGVGAQASPESSSDAGFDESMDMSCGKDMHSFTRYYYIIKGEKLGTFDFVVEMLVLVWDTPGLMLILTEFEGL